MIINITQIFHLCILYCIFCYICLHCITFFVSSVQTVLHFLFNLSTLYFIFCFTSSLYIELYALSVILSCILYFLFLFYITFFCFIRLFSIAFCVLSTHSILHFLFNLSILYSFSVQSAAAVFRIEIKLSASQFLFSGAVFTDGVSKPRANQKRIISSKKSRNVVCVFLNLLHCIDENYGCITGGQPSTKHTDVRIPSLI